MKVFLAIMIVVSLAVFVNSVMRYNVLLEEQRELEEQLEAYREMKEELQELLDSGEDYDVIVRIAKEKWGLQFPDEEIFYKD